VLYVRSVRRSTLRGGSVLLPVSCLMRSLSSEREKLSTNQISSMHLSPSLKCNYFWFCDSLDITLVAQVHNKSFLISIYTICTCLKKKNDRQQFVTHQTILTPMSTTTLEPHKQPICTQPILQVTKPRAIKVKQRHKERPAPHITQSALTPASVDSQPIRQ